MPLKNMHCRSTAYPVDTLRNPLIYCTRTATHSLSPPCKSRIERCYRLRLNCQSLSLSIGAWGTDNQRQVLTRGT